MKKIFIAVVALLLISTAAYAAKQLSVQVRELPVKSSPNYMSQTVGTLPYGAPVDVASESGNWYQISQPRGFIPKNATGTAKPSVNSGTKYASKGASRDEVALAGKGFNPQVEAQYKRDNPSLASAFSQVDRVEAINISLPELDQFIIAGKLNK